jgi:hypothetical protein
LVYGKSSADRIGCLDQDGDNYSDPTNDWGIAEGADAYPQDPTRWLKEADDEEDSAGSLMNYAAGGIGLIVILAGVGALLFMRGRSNEEEQQIVNNMGHVAMPNFQAQPAAQVAMPNFQAQPAAQIPPQPAAMPDPARDYYNGLLAQGYPHGEAVRYTQQYFQEFRG